MVAAERRMRAESEEELKELKQEKEALCSALQLIDGENTTGLGVDTVDVSHLYMFLVQTAQSSTLSAH